MEADTGFAAICAFVIFVVVIRIFWAIDQAKWRKLMAEEERKKKKPSEYEVPWGTFPDSDPIRHPLGDLDRAYGMPYAVYEAFEDSKKHRGD